MYSLQWAAAFWVGAPVGMTHPVQLIFKSSLTSDVVHCKINTRNIHNLLLIPSELIVLGRVLCAFMRIRVLSVCIRTFQFQFDMLCATMFISANILIPIAFHALGVFDNLKIYIYTQFKRGMKKKKKLLK